ncbi:Os02g0514150, partial [Oryza sativa Japonica Group]
MAGVAASDSVPLRRADDNDDTSLPSLRLACDCLILLSLLWIGWTQCLSSDLDHISLISLFEFKICLKICSKFLKDFRNFGISLTP